MEYAAMQRCLRHMCLGSYMVCPSSCMVRGMTVMQESGRWGVVKPADASVSYILGQG